MTDSSNSTPGALEEGVLGAFQRRLRAAFTPRAVPTFVDFAEHAPYVDMAQRYLIDHYGCAHAFFEIEAPSADVASAGRLVNIQTQIVNIIERLPAQIGQIQFIYTTNGDYRRMISEHAEYVSGWPIIDYLRQERAKLLMGESARRLLIRSSTIMVLACLPKEVGQNGVLSELKRTDGNIKLSRKPITRAQFEESVATLAIGESIIKDSLAKLGIRVQPINAEGVADYLYRLFNQGLAWDVGIPVIYDYDITPINDAWLCSDVELMPDCLKIGDYFHGFVSMAGKPQETTPRVVEMLTTKLGFSDVRVTTSIRRLDKNEEMEKLRKMRMLSVGRMKEPLNMLDRLKNPTAQESSAFVNLNVEAKDQVEEANELLSDLRAGADYLATLQLGVHFWAKDHAELERRRELIMVQMSNMNRARPWPEKSATLPVFKATLPASIEPFHHSLKVRGKMAADLVPIHRGFEGGAEPVCLFRNSTGGLVSMNLFNSTQTDAPMAFVAGGAGSGKSFLINQVLMQHMVETPLIIILDVGGSYSSLIRLVGGQVLEFNEETPFCFNPLQIYGGGTSGTLVEPDVAARSRMVRSIEAMVSSESDPGGMLDEAHITKIDRAIETAFTVAITHGKPYVGTSDLLKLFTEYQDSALLAERIKPFTRGQLYGKWFDGPTNVDLRTQVLCFDLKGIRKVKRLTKALVPLIINYIHDIVMANRGQRKIIVFDEMWEFILSSNMMNFIVEAWKTFRKENSALIGCSQNLATDIASNERIKGAIIQNTETWMLLNQGPGNENRLTSDLLGLTDGQHDLLSNLQRCHRIDRDGSIQNWREGLLIRGKGEKGESGKIRIQPTAQEYWLSTMHPSEITERERVLQQFDGDLMRAIDYLAKKHPGGTRLEHVKK